jgi:hypothetical protein
MAIINSYPLATPKLTDLVLGTSTSSTGQTSTKSFTIQSIKDTTAAVKTIVTATPDTLAITGTTNVTINTITAAVTNGGNGLATGNDIYDFVVGKITGTANTVPIWTGTTPSTTLGDSLISQANSGVIISGNSSAQTDGKLTLNCWNGNHGVTIQAPSHSVSATYTLILPTDSNPGAGKVLTSGAGSPNQLSWTDNGNVGGTGTQNKLSKWSTATTLADSNVEDTGTLVTISSAAKVTGNLELDADLLDVNGGTGTAGQLLSSLGTGNGIDWVDAPVTGVVTVTDGNTTDNQGITIGGTTSNPTVAANIATVTNTSKNLATGEQIQAAIDLTVLTVATGNSDTITIGGTATNPTVAANTTSGVGANLNNLATGGQIQAAIDAALAGAVTFKGTFNASTGAITGGGNLTSGGSRVAVAVGDMYVVSVGGNFYGNSSTPLNVGDEVIAVSAAVAGASVEGDWNAVPSAGGGITGGGTTNKVPLWTGTTVLGDSEITQSSTNIGIGTTSPSQKLTVAGSISTTGSVLFNDNQGINFGNSNARIYGSSADGIKFNGSGSEKMRLTQAGNLGIGSTNPVQKLTVAGNIDIAGGNGSFLTFNNGDAKIVINNNGTGRDLSFETYNGSSTTEKMRISNAGMVGIGTTSPSVGVPLTAFYNTTSQFHFGGLQSGISNNVYYNSTLGVYTNRNTSAGGSLLQMATDGSFSFRRATSGSSPTLTYSMVIDGSGDVGIGASSPSEKLEVIGNIYAGVSNGGGFMLTGASASGLVRNNASGVALRTNTTDRLIIDSAGQVKFSNYTAPGSFTGTAAANLAVDGSGNIITEAASGGGGGGTKTVSTVASVAASVSTHALGVTVTTTPLVNYVDLYISGVYQSKTSYTVSGSTLTLNSPATFPTGALIETVTTT